MNWGLVHLWELTYLGGSYALKVSNTAVRTTATSHVEDENVNLSAYLTDTGKLVGYNLATRGRPRRLVRPMCLCLFYSKPDLDIVPERKPLEVMYFDPHVRLLAFGDEDYMLVIRGQRGGRS